MLYGIPTVWLRIFVVTWRRLCRCVAPVHTSPHTRPLPSTGVSFGLLAGSRARINFDSVPFDRIVIYRNAPPSKKCIRQHFLFVLCSFVFDSKVFAREWVRALWQWFSRVWNDSHNLTGCRANSLICKRYTTPQYLCVFDIFACAFWHLFPRVMPTINVIEITLLSRPVNSVHSIYPHEARRPPMQYCARRTHYVNTV